MICRKCKQEMTTQEVAAYRNRCETCWTCPIFGGTEGARAIWGKTPKVDEPFHQEKTRVLKQEVEDDGSM